MIVVLSRVIFWLFAFIIAWAMVGYQVSLKVLGKIFSHRRLEKNYYNKPFITLMAVAYNEEKVILEKLNNMVDNDYPEDRIEYIVASDCSTDKTHDIVSTFIEKHSDISIRLIIANNHAGKTNAQNEAQKFANGEVLVMTDANAMLAKNAVSELVACFTSPDIAYVSGRLSYTNSKENATASSENIYWESDLAQREIESRIKTITAGNGAIYACRNSLYHDFSPIECHDSCMPVFYANNGKRAIYNPDAIGWEKAGETKADELKRKIRMNRLILPRLIKGLKFINIFRYGWFSYFYFGHRLCRYALWLAHILVLITSAVLSFYNWFYLLAFIGQVLFYMVGGIALKIKAKNKFMRLMAYYCMTIYAQFVGIYNWMTGKSKPIWESAETTR